MEFSFSRECTYSLEYRPSWEASRFSASHEITRILRNPNSITAFIRATTCPYPEPDQSVQAPIPLSELHLSINPHLCLGLPSGLFPQRSPPKPCMNLSSPPRTTKIVTVPSRRWQLLFLPGTLSTCSTETETHRVKYLKNALHLQN